MSRHAEIDPSGNVRVVTERSYDAVLGFGSILLRECDSGELGARVRLEMRLQRIYVPPQFVALISLEDLRVGDRSLLHGDGEVPGELLSDDLDTFDVWLESGTLLVARFCNRQNYPIKLFACGLGTRKKESGVDAAGYAYLMAPGTR